MKLTPGPWIVEDAVRDRQTRQAKLDIQAAALRWFVDYVRGDHDTQDEIMARAGIPQDDDGYILMHSALDEIAEAILKRAKRS